MQLKGVIFDLDGTLLDTESYKYIGCAEVMKRFGVDLSKEEYGKIVGKDCHAVDAEWRKKFELNIGKEQLGKQLTENVLNVLRKSELKLMPYAEEAVDFFKKMGVKIAAASGANREETEMKLKKLGIKDRFSIIVTSSDVEVVSKTNIYLHALKQMNLDVKNAIAIEDNLPGVVAAKKAGLTCFAVPNEFSKGQDFSQADAVFSSLKEAVDYMKKKYF